MNRPDRARDALWGRCVFRAGWSALLLTLAACNGSPPAAQNTGDTGDAGPKRPRRLHVSDEALRDAGIEVAKVSKQPLSKHLTLPGEVTAIPDRSARLSTPVAGRIERVTFNEGSIVARGDRLAIVRVPDLGKVRGAFAAVGARAAAAKAQFQRTKKLRADGLASEQDVINAEAEARSLDAEAAALGDQLAALGIGASGGASFDLPLVAPVSGVVTKRAAVVGQPIAADQSIAEIADLREAWFLARVYEKDLAHARAGAEAEVRLNAYPNEVFSGKVSFVGAQVDATARAVTARIHLTDRAGRLRIGLFGTAHVMIGGAMEGDALTVPRSALTTLHGKEVVFVRGPDGDFAPKNVLTGDASPGRVAVLAGLGEGDDVVVRGVFSLKSIALRAAIAEEEP